MPGSPARPREETLSSAADRWQDGQQSHSLYFKTNAKVSHRFSRAQLSSDRLYYYISTICIYIFILFLWLNWKPFSNITKTDCVTDPVESDIFLFCHRAPDMSDSTSNSLLSPFKTMALPVTSPNSKLSLTSPKRGQKREEGWKEVVRR